MQYHVALPRNAKLIGTAKRDGALDVALSVYQRGRYYYAHHATNTAGVATERRDAAEHTTWLARVRPCIDNLVARGEVSERSGCLA